MQYNVKTSVSVNDRTYGVIITMSTEAEPNTLDFVSEVAKAFHDIAPAKKTGKRNVKIVEVAEVAESTESAQGETTPANA